MSACTNAPVPTGQGAHLVYKPRPGRSSWAGFGPILNCDWFAANATVRCSQYYWPKANPNKVCCACGGGSARLLPPPPLPPPPEQCAFAFKPCWENRCCASRRQGCFRAVGKFFAMCRQLPAGDCVSDAHWQCPGWDLPPPLQPVPDWLKRLERLESLFTSFGASAAAAAGPPPAALVSTSPPPATSSIAAPKLLLGEAGQLLAAPTSPPFALPPTAQPTPDALRWVWGAWLCGVVLMLCFLCFSRLSAALATALLWLIGDDDGYRYGRAPLGYGDRGRSRMSSRTGLSETLGSQWGERTEDREELVEEELDLAEDQARPPVLTPPSSSPPLLVLPLSPSSLLRPTPSPLPRTPLLTLLLPSSPLLLWCLIPRSALDLAATGPRRLYRGRRRRG